MLLQLTFLLIPLMMHSYGLRENMVSPEINSLSSPKHPFCSNSFIISFAISQPNANFAEVESHAFGKKKHSNETMAV